MKKKFFLISLCMAVCINLALLFPYITPPANSADTISIKIANFFPPPSKQSKITEEFGKDLEKRSGGRIKVQYFAGGSLLKAPAIYKGIESGITDIGYAHVYYTPGRFPVSEGIGLPLGTPSAVVGAHVAWDFYQQFKPKEWDNVKLLALHGNAPSMIISKKPVEKLDDLKGLKIRAPGVPGEIIKALGGAPTPTPMMEVYDSLAKGVNEGVYAPYETLRTFRFGEVCKYVTAAWQTGNPFPFFLAMNKRKYNSLPEDLKVVVDTLSGEYQERYSLMWNEIEFAGKAFGASKGVTYFELSDQEAARWQKAVEPVIANYIKTMTGKGFSEAEVKGWVDFMKERINYWTAKQIEYKVPSPTGPAGMRPEAFVLK
jgi:TRAP-type C4-dicarboxylate transport system substrate-binding protein